MKILIKFPTRERKHKLVKTMGMMLANINNKEDTRIVLTLDENDTVLNQEFIDKKVAFYKDVYNQDVEYIIGNSTGKIHAVNRDMEKLHDWDILMLMSDDMECRAFGFDTIVRHDMQKNFPDLDGVLFYRDGFTDLNTLCIIGRKYFYRFGYIYYPGYESFFCDNEFMEVADLLKKQYRSNEVLFFHSHPIWTGQGWDELYQKNNEPWERDKALYEKRKLSNFEVTV